MESYWKTVIWNTETEMSTHESTVFTVMYRLLWLLKLWILLAECTHAICTILTIKKRYNSKQN